MTVETEPQKTFLYAPERTAHAEIRVRFHAFEDERDVYKQLYAYKNPDNVWGDEIVYAAPCDVEEYKYAVKIQSGPLVRPGGVLSSRKSVAEVYYYRNAFKSYYGRDMKGQFRLLPSDDMRDLSKVGGLLATDLALQGWMAEDEKLIEMDSVEYDPADTLREGEIVNLSQQFLLMKDAHFDPEKEKRSAHVVTHPEDAALWLGGLGKDETIMDRFKKNVFTYHGQDKLVLLTARLL